MVLHRTRLWGLNGRCSDLLFLPKLFHYRFDLRNLRWLPCPSAFPLPWRRLLHRLVLVPNVFHDLLYLFMVMCLHKEKWHPYGLFTPHVLPPTGLQYFLEWLLVFFKDFFRPREFLLPWSR